MNFKTKSLYWIIIILTNLAIAEENLPNAWVDMESGLYNAYKYGKNGIIINGYAYHTDVHPIHSISFYNRSDHLNEFAFGIGYSRSYLNPKYNSEYSIGIMEFTDSFFKPELHAGYTYIKYWDTAYLPNFKGGLGYDVFIFNKPAWTSDTSVITPGAGIVAALRYQNTTIQLHYLGVLFLNFRIDI
jgi:hypothetical protein